MLFITILYTQSKFVNGIRTANSQATYGHPSMFIGINECEFVTNVFSIAGIWTPIKKHRVK